MGSEMCIRDSSEIELSTISGETHALINPIQLLFLYFWNTSEIVSPEGSKLFFFKCIPTKTGLLNFNATFEAISISLPLEITSR